MPTIRKIAAMIIFAPRDLSARLCKGVLATGEATVLSCCMPILMQPGVTRNRSFLAHVSVE